MFDRIPNQLTTERPSINPRTPNLSNIAKMTLLAQYRTVPTIEAIISKIWYQKADTPNLQNGLANELFHYYFPPAAG